jgi:hypothetical protein
MDRRAFLALAALAVPGAAFAQGGPPRQGAQQPRPRGTGQPGARHDEVLGRDFDDLPPGARERVQNEFRQGSPDLDDAGVRQRWNSMTPDQRGEALTARKRAQRRAGPPGQGGGRGPGRGAGPGPGAGRGPGAGAGPGPGPRGGSPQR